MIWKCNFKDPFGNDKTIVVNTNSGGAKVFMRNKKTRFALSNLSYAFDGLHKYSKDEASQFVRAIILDTFSNSKSEEEFEYKLKKVLDK